MKAYIKPQMIIEPLAFNPQWVEDSELGGHWENHSGIEDVGDVVPQVKGTHEEWGDLW